MRDPGVGIAPADIDHPLPKHRRIDERLAPEHVSDARMRTKERPNHFMRNERYLAGNDCRHAVIHDLQVQALEIRDVAWDVEGHDLASAAGEELVAASKTFEDRAALRWPVLVTDDIRVCFKLPHCDRQRGDCQLLVVRNRSDALKFSDQRGDPETRRAPAARKLSTRSSR